MSNKKYCDVCEIETEHGETPQDKHGYLFNGCMTCWLSELLIRPFQYVNSAEELTETLEKIKSGVSFCLGCFALNLQLGFNAGMVLSDDKDEQLFCDEAVATIQKYAPECVCPPVPKSQQPF